MTARPQRGVVGAVVSTDEALRLQIIEAASRRGIAVQVEIEAGPPSITQAHLKQLQLARPAVLFVDLGRGESAGAKLIEHLAEAHPEARIVAVAEEPSRDLLVSVIRAGAAEFLEKPVSGEDLDEALDRLERRLGSASAAQRPSASRIFTFFSAKGGAGATTVATNLAIQLRRRTESSVLLLDLDLELGEIAIFLGVDPRYSVVELMKNLHRLDEGLLATYVERHESGMDVLAAPYRPQSAQAVTADHVRRLLKFLREKYDYVIVDASNALSPAVVGAFQESDEIVVITQVDVPSIRNVQRCREMFESLGKMGVVRLVVNRFQPRTGEITLTDVEESVDMEVYRTIANDYDSVVYSINTGEPLALKGPAAASRDIEGLLGKLTGMEIEPPKRRGPVARFLDLFRGRSRAPRGDVSLQSRTAPPAARGSSDRVAASRREEA